jgi:quercetin dioxygenase-like cupin family protein
LTSQPGAAGANYTAESTDWPEKSSWSGGWVKVASKRGPPLTTIMPVISPRQPWAVPSKTWKVIMLKFKHTRRSFTLGLAGLGISHGLLRSNADAQAAAPRGYVLRADEGEHLIQRGGHIFIKTDPTRGSNSLAMGTQQILAGVGIPIHRHLKMDESFYVIDGRGTFILNDVRHPIEKGGSIFIPKNAWHGFENPDNELLLLWIVAPAGLEAFFREVATRPGVPPVQRTKDQLNEIARKYATEFR